MQIARAGVAPSLDFAPWNLSGVVYGLVLNDPASLEALGDAVNAKPYNAAPRAPVLYMKPRNTLAPSGTAVPMPADVDSFELGATLGIIVGKTACRVTPDVALDHVAGYLIAVDLFVPHSNFYRPNVRLRAHDRSLIIGPGPVARAAIDSPQSLEFVVRVNDGVRQRFANIAVCRGIVDAMVEVTEFMTLSPGDLVLLGTRHGAPEVRAGDRFSVECPPLGTAVGEIVAGPAASTAGPRS